MPDFVAALIFDSSINLAGLERDTNAAATKLRGLSAEANNAFQKDIARGLAKAVRPENFASDLAKSKALLGEMPKDVAKIFERELGRNLARKSLQPFVDETKTLSGQLKGVLASNFSFKNLALGVAGGIGLASLGKELLQLGKDAIVFSAQFETALAKVATIADKGVNISALRNDIKALSTEVPQDIVGLAEGLFDIIGSGIKNTSDALNVLEISAKAAVAGVSTTAEASKAIVFILNGFQKEVTEAQHVSDVLFKTVDEGVVSFSQLASVVGDIAAPAKAANVSLEDVSAAIAAMTKGGISAELTVTSLRNLIGDIITPSKAAGEAAKKLGLDFSKAGIEAAGGFAPFIKQIQELTKSDPNTLRKLFPDERATRAILQIAGSMSDEFQRLAKQFNDLTQVSGATERAFQIMNATAENQYKLFKNNLANAVEGLGHSLLESLKPALVTVNSIFADTRPIDVTIAKMIELGVASEQINFIQLRQQLIDTTANLKTLRDEAEKTITAILKASKLVNVGDRGERPAQTVTVTQQAAKDITNEFKDQLKTVEGLLAAEEKILALNKELASVTTEIGITQTSTDKSNLAALSAKSQNLTAQKNTLALLIKQQKEINAETLNEEKLRARIETSAKLQNLTKKEIKQAEQEALKAIEAIEANIAKAVKNKTIDEEKNLRNQLEIQRGILETIKLFSDTPKAVSDSVQTLSSSAKNTADEFERSAKAVKEIELSLESGEGFNAFKKSFQAQIDAKFNTPKFEIDEGAFNAFKKSFQNQQKELYSGLIPSEQDKQKIAEKQRELIRQAVDGMFDLLSQLNIGADKFVGSLQKLSSALLSGNIFGAVTSGLGLISQLFSKSTFDIRKEQMALDKLEDEKNRLLEIARIRTDRYNEALRRINETIQTGTVAELEKQLAELNAKIAELEKITDPRRIPKELEDLKKLRDELLEKIKNFGKVGEDFASQLEFFNLQLSLLNVTDPIKKLSLFTEFLKTKFGAKLPESISDFIKQGLDALQRAGLDPNFLTNFLKNAGLEELTAEQFKNLLQVLNDFINGTKTAVDDLTGSTTRVALIRSITFEQGNRLLDENTTMRILQTNMVDIQMQMLNIMKDSLRGGLSSASLSRGGAPNIFIMRDGNVRRASTSELTELERLQADRFLAEAKGMGLA